MSLRLLLVVLAGLVVWAGARFLWDAVTGLLTFFSLLALLAAAR